MPKNQTIRFSDEAIAKVDALVAVADKRSFNYFVNKACEDLPDPKPVKKPRKAKSKS